MNQPLDELRDFHKFVGEKLAKNGAAPPSPEDVLEEWRELHPEALDEDDIAAIQEALDDIANGDEGISGEDFEREVRARYNLSPKP